MTDCKLCAHKPVCDLWRIQERQDAALYSGTEECDFFLDEQHWIPVTERIPYQTDPAQKVLFVTKKGCIYTGTYFKGVTTNQFDGWYSMCARIGGVTHWMPLPEPPKEG